MCHQFPVDVFADIDLHGSELEAVEFLLQPRFITVDDFREKNFIGISLKLEPPLFGVAGFGPVGERHRLPESGRYNGVCLMC